MDLEKLYAEPMKVARVFGLSMNPISSLVTGATHTDIDLL
jgi:hypothetical protein